MDQLCDDDFEEHVLPYPPEKSGLHLHGINENAKDFCTQPTDIVDKFADEWGFIKTRTTVLNSIKEVCDFTTEVGKTGKWEGEALEGFVVRTQVAELPTDGIPRPGLPPYEPGSSFFFKFKFDEPYMMYRDWREVTKILLSTKGPLSNARLPKAKLKRPETILYVKWIKGEIGRDRRQFENFSKGKGIIATRDRFLKWMGTGEAKEAAADEDEDFPPLEIFGKTIILPIAVPGVGEGFVSHNFLVIFSSHYRKNVYLGGPRTSLWLRTHSKRRFQFQEGCFSVYQESSGVVGETRCRHR